MTRTGYDSTSMSDIPKTATLVLPYADGAYRQGLEDAKKRFPHATIWSISTQGDVMADWYDVETGLLTPTEGAKKAQENVKAGKFAGLYCNLSTWPAVRKAVDDLGLAGKVSYWIAHYDGEADIPKGAVGKQYLSPAIPGAESGGHYDVSVFVDFIKGLDVKPKPPKAQRTPMSVLERRRASKLLAALKKRTHGLVDIDQVALGDLGKQIDRVRGLK